MNDDPLQEALADEGAFTGETDESELQALVSRLQTNILIIGSGGAGNNTLLRSVSYTHLTLPTNREV